MLCSGSTCSRGLRALSAESATASVLVDAQEGDR
jgi:hypothetical protein